MKSTIKIFGVIVFVFAMAFTMSTCGDPDGTHTHNYGSWITKTAASCTAKEVQERTCSCGDEQTQEVGEPLGHDWKIKTATATCTTAGDVTFACDREGCYEEYGDVVDQLGHAFSTIPATCTSASIPGTCTRDGCNELNPEEVVLALGHSFIETIPSTCTNSNIPGICARAGCDEIDAAVPALGHDFKWLVTNTTYPATSTQSCSRCDAPAIDTPRVTQIGDTGPAGGIIFYVKPEGFALYTGSSSSDFSNEIRYYLEVASANESIGAEWGAYGLNIPGTSTQFNLYEIGFGRRNTQIIINYLNNMLPPETGSAAQLCADKDDLDGTDWDWFLPSFGELYILNENKDEVNNAGGDLTGDYWYWSSTQFGPTMSYCLNFGTDEFLYTYKDYLLRVRPIRAF